MIQTPIPLVHKVLPLLLPVLARVQAPANVIPTLTLLVHKVHLALPPAQIRAPQSLVILSQTLHAAKELVRVILLYLSY